MEGPPFSEQKQRRSVLCKVQSTRDVERGDGRRGERGNCGQDINEIKKINLKKNEYSQSILRIAYKIIFKQIL